MVSGITHGIAGFCSIYIAVSGMHSMKKQNLPLVCGILVAFCVMAYVANILLDYNYMFLMRGDGTPYDIAYNLVGGHAVLYPAIVVVMFFVYILAYFGIYHAINKARLHRKRASAL